MANEFQGIRMVSMDESVSLRPNPNTGLYDVLFKLSIPAPDEWADYFNTRWDQHLYTAKRRATVSGSNLEICCVPDELNKYHMPELLKIIAETNNAYKAMLPKHN